MAGGWWCLLATCRTAVVERTAIEWTDDAATPSWVIVGVVLVGVSDPVAVAAAALESPTLRTSAQARRSQLVSRRLASMSGV